MRKLFCTTSLFVGIPAVFAAIAFAVRGVYHPPEWARPAFGWLIIIGICAYLVVLAVRFWGFCSELCEELRSKRP